VDPTLSSIAPVNKYFTQSGGPSASNTEKFPGDSITSSTIIYGYAETGTAATKAAPMKTYGNHNYPKPIINTAPILQ
jgi:hypothetical protein